MTIDNKKAYFEYEIIDKYETGIVLVGSEVKSIRTGHASLRDAFCFVEKNEVFLKNCQITVYDKSFAIKPDERRSRKLLLHAFQIKRLIGKSKEKGYSIIPLKMYFKGQHVKLEIALAKGKKEYEKKQTIKDRDNARDMQRQLSDVRKR